MSPLILPADNADETPRERVCDECGQPFEAWGDGVAEHLDGDGDVDHEADLDRAPYTLEGGDPATEFTL